MYKKVLYNIKKIKIMWGEGEGKYLNPKHSHFNVFKQEDQWSCKRSPDILA